MTVLLLPMLNSFLFELLLDSLSMLSQIPASLAPVCILSSPITKFKNFHLHTYTSHQMPNKFDFVGNQSQYLAFNFSYRDHGPHFDAFDDA
jgi:hypothetical protein